MKVAILGYGTVGRGAFEAIKSAADVDVTRVLVRRDTVEIQDIQTQDVNTILEDPEIDLVAECMGGIHPALEYVMGAMEHGKHVATPNKSLVSAYYDELHKCAQENGVQLRFTSAAGGGIPWLYNLQRSKRCDTMTEVHGIVNGTCNYILDHMHTNGTPFEDVLREAQELGYAESDPSADIEGWDTQRKCVLSANLAFDTSIHEKDVPVLGIHNIRAEDIQWFNRMDITCRLLMNASTHNGRVSAYVEPTLLPKEALESSVNTNFNLISLTGQNIGSLSFYGQGAGKMPTGTSLVQDIIDIKDGIGFTPAALKQEISPEVDNSLVEHPYYFRIAAGEDFPENLVDSIHRGDSYQHIRTKALSVEKAHALAKGYPAAFVAGYKE